MTVPSKQKGYLHEFSFAGERLPGMERGRNGGSLSTFEEGMRPRKEGIPGGLLLTVASFCYDTNERKDNKIFA